MGWPDYAIFAIIGASILVGMMRGLVKEVFSLVVWVVAIWSAFQFSGDVAGLLESGVSLPSARMAIAFIGVFLVVLLVGGLITYLVGQLVEKTGLTGTDRLAGGIFGAARGLVLVIAILVVAGFTPVPNDPWWKASPMIQRMMPLAVWASEYLPDSLKEHLDLEGTGENETGGQVSGEGEHPSETQTSLESL